MAGQLRDAGGRLGDVPLVGDEVAAPFDKAADASDGIAGAGRDIGRRPWSGWRCCSACRSR